MAEVLLLRGNSLFIIIIISYLWDEGDQQRIPRPMVVRHYWFWGDCTLALGVMIRELGT